MKIFIRFLIISITSTYLINAAALDEENEVLTPIFSTIIEPDNTDVDESEAIAVIPPPPEIAQTLSCEIIQLTPTPAVRFQNVNFADQEAILRLKNDIKSHYQKLISNSPHVDLISRELPRLNEIYFTFDEPFQDLKYLYDFKIDERIDQNKKFVFKCARRGLRLINGENLERHRISGIHDYSNYGYHGFPNIRQLLILNWRLCRVNIRDFVETYIATECSTPEKWQEWRKLFIKKPAFRDILAFEDFSLCLQADRLSGAHFIGSIVEYIQHGEKLPAFGTKKIMRDLHAKYLEFRVEQINPITEALFMVMRGHNAELLNREHPNLPACAEGAYLGMLRALEELLPGEKAYRAVVLDGCA